MNNYVSLENFTFFFRQETNVFFDHLSLKIDKPGLIFIVGKNGVGKSTFFRILQGVIHSQEQCSGLLQIKDQIYNLAQSYDRNRLHNASRILHQSFDSMLVSKFTGFENLAFAKFHHNPDLSLVHVKRNVPSFMHLFNIPLDRQVALLSGGQRQMLALVMVTQKPIDLLLLDEPTAALDSKNSDYVMQGVRKLAEERNICVICVSHDLDLVKNHADYVVTIAEDNNHKKTFDVQVSNRSLSQIL